MAYYVFKEDKHEKQRVFWNRRKKTWQDIPDKSCEYPTFKGAWRIALMKFDSQDNMPRKMCFGFIQA